MVALGGVAILFGDLWFADALPGPLGAIAEAAGRWGQLVALVIGAVGGMFRRRRPAVAMIIETFALAVSFALGGSIVVVVIVFDLAYNVTRWGGRWLRGIGVVAVGTTSLVVGGLAAVGADDRIGAFGIAVLQCIALFGLPIWWATNVRQQAAIARLAEERLVLERERSADLVRLAEAHRAETLRAERARMASDLHDSIASRLSAIAMHSAAALAHPAASTPGDAAALRSVRTSSLEALGEMRQMIAVLRDESGDAVSPTAPTASLGSLGALIDEARRGGSTVEIDIAIDAATLDRIPAPVAQAAYRIVQESLTNARKHAPGRAVAGAIEFDGSRLALRIENPMPSDDDLGDGVLRGGAGLDIMRSRAAACGGALSVGPSEGGRTWLVEASLPIDVGGSADER